MSNVSETGKDRFQIACLWQPDNGELIFPSNEPTKGEELKDIDWENRVLCSDESCIGVIGADGRCKECGKAYEGELPFSEGPAEEASADETVEAPAPPEDQAPETSAPGSDEDYDPNDWDQRKLCSDGNCIGVIGPDGRCKECGKTYTG